MRSIAYSLAAVALFAFALPVTADTNDDPISIVFIAYQNPEQVLDDVRPVVHYLEQELGRKVEHRVATNYAGVIEALRNGTADMGFMGPLQYIVAHQVGGARAILGEVYQDKPYYHSRIFVRKDSGIENISQLKGKTIAFSDPVSSSGYLYPVELFRSEGLVKSKPEDFFKRVFFSGGDEQAIRAVYNGFVDAAGLGQFAYSLLLPEERDEITYIGESKPLPSHCVVVGKSMPDETVTQLKNALLALNDGPNHHLLQMLYGVDGYVEVSHETYAEVEELARQHDLIK